MPQTPDQEIIKRVKDGELDHFSHIVHKYTKPILSYVAHKLFEKDDAEDIVQNVFLQFYKHIDRFDDSKPVLSYLYGIAKNELKMYYRTKKPSLPLDESLVAEDELIPEGDMDEILQSLSKDQREPLKLLYEGYTYEEIAVKLKKPVNTIKTIVRRTRLKLQKTHEKT